MIRSGGYREISLNAHCYKIIVNLKDYCFQVNKIIIAIKYKDLYLL
jgi:hypothetical protein